MLSPSTKKEVRVETPIMMEDSLVDLYKKASNPMRTNKQKIRLADTPFVREDVRSRASSRSRRSQYSVSSRHSRVSSRKSRKSRESSRRSRRRSERSRRVSPPANDPPAFFESVKPPPTRLSEPQRMRLQAEKTREKQVLLHELSRMQMSGSQLCRNLSMDDNLADIEYELNRTKAKDDCVSTVAFMKDAIKFGVTGIEMLNSKFKVLKLNGWSSEATRDMNRYDRSLTKLYTRYMRKGSVSPILELGFLLFGSMILCHMKNSFMGGMMGSSSSPAAPSAPQRSTAAPPPPFAQCSFQPTRCHAGLSSGSHACKKNNAQAEHIQHSYGHALIDEAYNAQTQCHVQSFHGASVESKHSSAADCHYGLIRSSNGTAHNDGNDDGANDASSPDERGAFGSFRAIFC